MVRNPDQIVFVCNGPDCRKHKAERKKLVAIAREGGVELSVGCQKICKGPAVGVAVDGELAWFGKLRTKRDRKGLKKLLETGEVSNDLEARRVTKRAGKLRS